jgi:alkylhydroperoxidase family enzyme
MIEEGRTSRVTGGGPVQSATTPVAPAPGPCPPKDAVDEVAVRGDAAGPCGAPPEQAVRNTPVVTSAGASQSHRVPIRINGECPTWGFHCGVGPATAAWRAYDLAMPSAAEPRIAPLPPEEWDDRLRAILEASPGGAEEPMRIFATLARSPDLFRRWMGFGGALLYGSLPSRLCELVILRTAYRFDGFYEWAQHVEMGQARGVTVEEIEALGGDAAALDSVPWTPLERAALAAVDETRADGAVSDATWAALSEHLDDAGLIELLMLIAHYLMLTTVLRSIRMQPEPRALAQAKMVRGGPRP